MEKNYQSENSENEASIPGQHAFVTSQRVRFGHIDPAGIVYFPRIFNFVHEAFEDLWSDFMCIPYNKLIEQDRIGFPTVHAEADFKHGLHFGERPVVEITCSHIGHTSVSFRYRYWVKSKLRVEAKTTNACINLNTMKSISIPETYRNRFMTLMEEVDLVINPTT